MHMRRISAAPFPFNHGLTASISLATLVFVGCGNATASIVYGTGFDPPGFTSGLLDGQDAWAEQVGVEGTPSWSVLDIHPRSGTQSIHVEPTLGGIGPAGFRYSGFLTRAIPATPTGSPSDPSEAVLRCQASIRLDPNFVARGILAPTVGFSETTTSGVGFFGFKILFELFSRTDGFHWVAIFTHPSFNSSANRQIDGGVASLGEYTDLSLEFDRVTKIATFRVNGDVAGAVESGLSGINGKFLNFVTVGSIGGDPNLPPAGLDIDDVSVSLVPSPASLIVLVTAGGWMARRRPSHFR